MVTLPIFGMFLALVMKVWLQLQGASSRHQMKRWPLSQGAFQAVCLLIMVVKYAMFVYIRGQAIKDAHGGNSETEVGFGQILALFT